jgi:hypothetical protein
VLRRIFGPTRDEITGKWRRLQNEELPALYALPNIIRVMESRRCAKYVAQWGKGGANRILVRRTEGRRPFGRPKRRWEDNIKADLREEGYGHGLDSSGSGQ